MVFKPHVVIVQAVSEDVDSDTKAVSAPQYGEGESVACQLMPAREGSVNLDKGGKELVNPHVLLCEIADAAKFMYGARVTDAQGRKFVVRTDPNLNNAGGVVSAAAHARVLLEKLEKAS